MTTVVILVPGIAGSVLEDKINDRLVWLNIALFDSTDYAGLAIGVVKKDPLALVDAHLYKEELQSAFKNLSRLEATRAFDYGELLRPFGNKLSLPGDYSKTKEFFRSKGYDVIEKKSKWQLPTNTNSESRLFFEFPYDWRQTVNDNADKLNEFIISSIRPKVTNPWIYFLSHSTGGLIVRTYLRRYGILDIRKHFMLGTPNHGAPKAYTILRSGIGFLWHRPVVRKVPVGLRDLMHGIRCAYDLLPSRYYQNFFDTYGPIVSICSLPEQSIDGTYIAERAKLQVPEQALRRYTLNNDTEVERALDFHDSLGRDTYLSGYTYVVFGTGSETIAGVDYVATAINSGNLRFTSDGDGTVPARSVYDLDGITDNFGKPKPEYSYKVNVLHTDLPIEPQVLNWVISKIA